MLQISEKKSFRSWRRTNRGNKSIIEKIISFVFLAYRINLFFGTEIARELKHKLRSLQPYTCNNRQHTLSYRSIDRSSLYIAEQGHQKIIKVVMLLTGTKSKSK